MESRKLEIIVHHAKDLLDVKHLRVMDPYVECHIGGDVKKTTRKTTVAKKGGSFPVWECAIEFHNVPVHTDCILFCKIKHGGKLLDREIGEVQVPFSDLLAGDASGERVAYPVTIRSGEVKGEIVFSHTFSKTQQNNNDVETSSRKDDGVPVEEIQQEKRKGFVGRVAEKVVTKVAAEAILFAGLVAVVAATD